MNRKIMFFSRSSWYFGYALLALSLALAGCSATRRSPFVQTPPGIVSVPDALGANPTLSALDNTVPLETVI